MRLNMCEVQPVPYEPCHGRPDSQPARPRLPPGCGSRTQSSPSVGAPPPLRTLDLVHRCRQKRWFYLLLFFADQMQHNIMLRLWCSTLTSAFIDSPRLLIKVVGVRLVKIETLSWVRHRSAGLWLVWEWRSRRQDRTRQGCLGASMRIPLVRQLQRKHQDRWLIEDMI